jgi:hypothetical protein
MSAREKLAHLFNKYDRARDQFLEARARERMILDVMKRENIDAEIDNYIRNRRYEDESRPE